VCATYRPPEGPPLACPRLAAVRSPALNREAGNQAERFLAASSFRAIRDVWISKGGAGRDGRRWNRVLLAAGAAGYERRLISRRAEPDAGRGQGSGGEQPGGSAARNPPYVRCDVMA
jgi:hypothetical protein